MNSPIAHLTEVLQTVKDSAETFAPQLQGNEAATRAALIDPVLRALGWDIANPARVLIEKTQTVHGQSLRVDYALLVDGEIGVIIEAKKLGGSIKEHFLQLVTYSFGLHVGSLFISDGLCWQHYVNLTHNNTLPTKEFNLAKDSLPQTAAYLVQHLDSALIAPETPQIDELSERVEELEQQIERLKQSLTFQHDPAKPNLTPASTPADICVPPTPAKESSLAWSPVDPDTHNYSKTKTTHLQLPDRSEQTCTNWAQVLVECCRFALTTAPELQHQLPIPSKSGGTIMLVSADKPAGSLSYKPLVVEGRTFWICTNFSAPSVAANSLYILSKVPDKMRPFPLSVVLR